MVFYDKGIEESVELLQTSLVSGLNDKQVEERLNEYGLNKLKEKKKKTLLQRFIDQFKDVMILILIGAAIISFIVACVEMQPKEFFEPILILVIVITNAIMGVMQENKAEKALEALASMSAPHARVIRNGKEQIIESSLLVPGDLILLEAGDFIPADCRLISSASLKSEESALTGESVASEKDANDIVELDSPLGDRSNMLFSGCSITYGSAKAIVTDTGMNSEMGKIANLLDSEEDGQTPLQLKLAQLGKYLGILAIACCIIIFIVGILNDIEVLEIFMTAVSLAVSAIPEGLPAIVTIVLSIGVERMVKKNAIIKRLPAVETLGSASVICSDKTGTLTQNQMTLVKAWVEGMDDLIDVSDSRAHQLLTYGTLCCDGSIEVDGDHITHLGDPTETSIIYAAYKAGYTKQSLNEQYKRIYEIPFDSDRKLMSSVNIIDGKKIVIVKGAVDMMTSRIIQGDVTRAAKMNELMSEQALRVLAIGYKEIDELPATPSSDNLETDLILLGLVGMIDPPRPEAKIAVDTCKKAGIRPVMITGDHVVTATAIAKELGIYNEGDMSITGVMLDRMNDLELDDNVENISVYARVSPENKIRIVKAWQRKGKVVSMTGDGVNDAPALKAADIGCAMGITGTDVAKGAADMILTDDNFSTIVSAIREGRGIYSNIKKVVGFLLGTNIGEVVTVFTAMMLWHQSPFLSIQLLWINLVTDSLPAIALGMEPVEDDVMEQGVRSKDESLFAHGYGIRIVLQGIMFGVLSLTAFKIGQIETGTLEGGQTLAFMVLALSQIVQAYNMRSDHSLFEIGVFTNNALNKAALISVIMMLAVLFTPLSVIFGLVYLPLKLYLFGLGLIIIPLIIMELTKTIGIIKKDKK